MIFDYNVISDSDGYYVFADKYPDINNSYDWSNAKREDYGSVVLYVGPSGKLVDIDTDRNASNYESAKLSVTRVYKGTGEDYEYNHNSIKFDEYGNAINFDKWLLTIDEPCEGGYPYFSTNFVNLNDLYDKYMNQVESAMESKIDVKVSNENMYISIGAVMNIKTNKPIVKADNSITRKEKPSGVVIRSSK